VIRILPASEHVAASPERAVSYLADGRQVVWEPSVRRGRIACDAELLDQPPPRALSARFAARDFNAAWTRAEVAAKLSDTPILCRLREHGLEAPSHIHTVVVDDAVVSFGSSS
jgi:hypothetical protein